MRERWKVAQRTELLNKVFWFVFWYFYAFIRDFISRWMTGSDGREMGNDMQQRSSAGHKVGTLQFMDATLNPSGQGAPQGQNSFSMLKLAR